ncbi:MAG: ion transporter [Roseibacillus sp.]|nr:ion transporter [Roseibacillus sp.]
MAGDSSSSGRSSIRERLWTIIFEAETKPGKAFDVLLLWAIGLSVVAVMLDSMDSFATRWGGALKVAEWGFTLLFMAEYFVRIWVVRRPARYVFSFFGIIDFLSWIPTFLGIFLVGSQSLLVIRILRLLRMFRVLKMVGHMRGASIIMRGLLASRAKITVFFFAMVVLATLMGTIAYLLESGQPQSKFTNIPVSIYWAIVTVTTLGYGDLAPLTVEGKFLSALCVLIGYSIMAVPTGIVIGETVNAAMNRQDETTDACPSCGVHGHLLDARYCRRCGERLNVHESASDPPSSHREDAGET